MQEDFKNDIPIFNSEVDWDFTKKKKFEKKPTVSNYRSRDGRLIKIQEMEDGHLQNAISYFGKDVYVFKRWDQKELLYALEYERHRRANDLKNKKEQILI